MDAERHHRRFSVVPPKWSSRRAASFPSIVIVWLMICLSLVQPTFCQLIRAGNFIDDDIFIQCKSAAAEADVDMNMQLSTDEYITFINLYSDDDLQETAFGDLPLRLILIYHWVACFCTFEPNSSTQCCVGDNSHISLDDSIESQLSLGLFCAQTYDAIIEIVGTSMPSFSLSPSNEPSSMPSRAATPSRVPSTELPSTAPSMEPSSMAPSTKPSSTAPSTEPSATASIVPSPTPSVAAPTSFSPTSGPSAFTAPTISSAPSPAPSFVPSYAPSPAPSFVPSYAPSSAPSSSPAPSWMPSSVPSFSPAPSWMPSSVPSYSPSIATTQPTAEGLLCISFQYSLRNEANLTANDIFNEVNNTLKSRLVIATEITVTGILNETFPKTLRITSAGGNLINSASTGGSADGDANVPSIGNDKGLGELEAPDLSHVLSVQQASSQSESATHVPLQSPLRPLFGPKRRLFSSSTLTMAVENAAIASLGGDQLASDIVEGELEEWMVSQDHLERVRNGPFKRGNSRSGRRLVYYTNDIPATIVSIADAPLWLCPGAVETPNSRCVIISEAVCVVLGPNDNEQVVRAVLIRGLESAINSGEFEENVPPS